jgi:hypothetical protein
VVVVVFHHLPQVFLAVLVVVVVEAGTLALVVLAQSVKALLVELVGTTLAVPVVVLAQLVVMVEARVSPPMEVLV